MRAHPGILILALLAGAPSLPDFGQAPGSAPANNPLKDLKNSGSSCPDLERASAPVPWRSYTVELKTTMVETLANGATITRQSGEIRAVDSQHRTYISDTYEMPFDSHQPAMTMVRIEDPVENTRTNWNSQSQEAMVLKLPAKDQRSGCWQSDSGHARFNYGAARTVSGRGGGTGAGFSSVMVSMGGVSSTAGMNQAAGSKDYGIGGSAGALPLPHDLPPMARSDPQPEDLGTATIEGVEVRGHRTTETIPAGRIGNDRPLVSTTESWTAPSLGGLELRSVRDDPQSGKSTTEVVRLDLSEPPPSTFQPPEGYKVIVEELHQVACQSPGQP